MNLRTKFFLYFLLAVTLPLVFSGWMTVNQASSELEKSTVNHLTSVADINKARLNEILKRYLDDVDIVASQNQIQALFAEYVSSTNTATLSQIQMLLRDIVRSREEFVGVTMRDTNGNLILSTKEASLGTVADPAFVSQSLKSTSIYEIFKDTSGKILLRVSGPLLANKKIIGIVEVVVTTDALISVTEDYAGLGKTGETTIARKNAAGDALFLTPLRFDSGAALTRAVSKNSFGIPMLSALEGIEAVFSDATTIDYRNKSIVAVTRFLPAVNWGLVVKIDREEVLSPIKTLRDNFLVLFFLVFFLVLSGSFVLARTLVRPIQTLTLKAEKLEKGDFSQRITVHSKDEIGTLANAFNNMAQKLQELYRGLEQKVKERTSQLEEAKAKDEALLASIGDGVFATNTTSRGRIVFMNKAAELMLGWKAEEVIGKPLIEMLPVEDEQGNLIPKEKRPMSIAFESGTTTTTTTTGPIYYYVRKDGSRFPAAITVTPVKLDGKIVGAIEVFRDIAKEKNIDSAKSEFVSLASHQLKTPATIVSLYTERMLNDEIGTFTPKQKDYVEAVRGAGRRMIAIVNALLDVSRIELGVFSFRPVSHDVITLIKEICHELQPRIKEKNLRLKTIYHTPRCVLPIDNPLLRMVLTNLISNAIQYTPEKKTVGVTTKKVMAGGTIDARKISEDSVVIAVSDEGCGIPENQQEKVFTKFFRADNARELHTDGTGLGLYVVKSILDHTGGTIWFRSKENEGTTFYVVIPLSGMQQKEGTKSLPTAPSFS